MSVAARSVQLGEVRHGSVLCLLADAQGDGPPAFAVAVRLHNHLGYWPHAHLVTAEPWSDENLRRTIGLAAGGGSGIRVLRPAGDVPGQCTLG